MYNICSVHLQQETNQWAYESNEFNKDNQEYKNYANKNDLGL